jgi:Putative bacterial sensory transduction regulator
MSPAMASTARIAQFGPFPNRSALLGQLKARTETTSMKNLIRLFVLLFAGFAALAAAPAMARNVVADVDQIAAVMKAAGYKVEIAETKSDRFIKAEAGGYNYAILVYGCDDKGKTCKSVQFFVAFDPKQSPTLEAMNKYAHGHRWGRVYLDDEGDPAIEYDLDLEKGGMSPELFLDNVEYWEAILATFAEFVFDGKDDTK